MSSPRRIKARRSSPLMTCPLPSRIYEVGNMTVKREKHTKFCLKQGYESSINPDLHNKIIVFLHDEKDQHERGGGFRSKQVREAAEHILSGFKLWYKKLSGLCFFQIHHASPTSKDRNLRGLECHHYDGGRTFKSAMTAQMTSCTGPQNLSKLTSRAKRTYQRQMPWPGTAGNSVLYVPQKMAHFLAVVPSWLSILGSEKFLGNTPEPSRTRQW